MSAIDRRLILLAYGLAVLLAIGVWGPFGGLGPVELAVVMLVAIPAAALMTRALRVLALVVVMALLR